MIQNYAWKQFAVESIRNGEIPLWNPYIFAGQPFLANGQHSMYYPFSWLFFILPIHTAFGWFTVIQLWLAGIGGWFFGRNLNLSNAAAAILGLIYQGSGFMLVSAAVFPMIIAAAVWLPFILAAIERIIQVQIGKQVDKKIRRQEDEEPVHHSSFTIPHSPFSSPSSTLPWLTLGSIALGLNVLAGHPEITYYTLLITGLYAAWRMITFTIYDLRFTNERPIAVNRKSPIVNLLTASTWLLIMVAIGLMLGAVQLLPAFELASTNFREGGATLEQIRGWAFPLRRVLTLLLPNFFGNPAHHSYTNILTGETIPFTLNYYGNPNPHGAGSSSWGIKNYVEGGIYLGILPLILAVLGVFSGKWKVESGKQNGVRTWLSSFLIHQSSFFIFLAFISSQLHLRLTALCNPLPTTFHQPTALTLPLGIRALAQHSRPCRIRPRKYYAQA